MNERRTLCVADERTMKAVFLEGARLVEMHTLESFDALRDDEHRNAAIARALGWKHSDALYRWEPSGLGPMPRGQGPGWQRGHDMRAGEPPPYYTAGDKDPWAADWNLLKQMWRALRERAQYYPEITDMSTDESSDFQAQVGSEFLDAPSPHRLLGRVMVMLSLVPKEESDG